jgi:hypothetical protein
VQRPVERGTVNVEDLRGFWDRGPPQSPSDVRVQLGRRSASTGGCIRQCPAAIGRPCRDRAVFGTTEHILPGRTSETGILGGHREEVCPEGDPGSSRAAATSRWGGPMPLREYFHPPVEEEHSWDELHGMGSRKGKGVRNLNARVSGLLPPGP